LTTKLNKQEEKNRVYSKLYKRSSKIGKFGESIKNIDDQTTLTAKQRSKLSIQAIKDADLNFDATKKEKKITLSDLSEAEKDQLFAAMRAQAPASV